ncbi:bacteriorhodopsin-like [Tuwongella immobilis]|uniref:Xanthorhodopsin n=1 Tax=Tuwongella immobilis TaxID=692036 RepID=A0A6C2YMB8_9BACT|nr:bacteriorhodopsin-like [Tuwongella immobilis]VIP02740.1 xanthorhodopsin : Rhodopsin OS=Isosphaera pallida (strain ATCC 43644 / DSM 9630 / IS1B) GN=Isop_3505 PE=4 SV=1: Bac_rhodopsin [Tuwongella immobilis]VTS02310.1 xanthorhodopsin : Rhodopsin OS=Isosphaera pallida (strain ATCC 43644 / DSM 9630 / IS1B) GN=Isop_3505 PE=4 SV=1: Bac_rhodopsin [Tuwongella immobilis]
MMLLGSLPQLSAFQFNIVDNMFSLTVATMGAAAIFFFAARSLVAPKYRPALMVSGLVVAIACYHYFMIRLSWQSAFGYADGSFSPTGKGFNDFYRYADWILTVPLLMVELIAVMGLAKEVARPMLTKLVIAAALMIGLGYPGEITQDWTTLMVWGMLSTLPFLYILFILWVELGKSLATQPPSVRSLVSFARLLIVATWMFYPIAYGIRGDSLPGAIPGLIPEKSGLGVVGTQIGYAIADITAKAGFGLLIFFIARAKTESMTDEERAEQMKAAAVMA